MKFHKVTTALFLLAATFTFMPACERELENECNPFVEDCVFTGNHPDGLSPGR